MIRRARGNVTRADDGAVVRAHHSGSPNRISASVVADEVTLGVNGGSTGTVAADVGPAGLVTSCFGLGRCSQQGQCDDGGGGDAFHECVDFHNRNFRRRTFGFIQGQLKIFSGDGKAIDQGDFGFQFLRFDVCDLPR